MSARKRRSPREAALHVVEQLQSAGAIAYFAGGCVRDMLLGTAPKDYDVATDAIPDRVHDLFPRSRMVGAKFGVVLVRQFGCDVEVATFRTDGRYVDGRRPEAVAFGSERDDALRRDFTINGMFFDPVADRLIDYVGGEADLEAGIIRTIGAPAARFAEDHLRMLRAVRFAARLDFVVDDATLEAIESHAAKLRTISAERVWMELSQILASPRRATGVRLLAETGLGRHLCPDWTLTDADALDRAAALPATELPATLGLSALLADAAEDDVHRIARSLKLSNVDRESLAWLVRSLRLGRRAAALELADVKTLRAHRCWGELAALVRADGHTASGAVGAADVLEARADRIPLESVQPAPLLTGDDLLNLGIPQGPGFGRVLGDVYRAQLNESIHTKTDALALARSMWRAEAR